nr:MarR family winged helix-turn-helix transcriptional regulator [Rhizobium sp. SL42]
MTDKHNPTDTRPEAGDGETQPGPDPALAGIGQAMTRMRLLIGRRFVGRMALKRIGTGLELSDIDAIGVIKRVAPHQEVTVGAIAEQMRIDPSRGSRIVADLVRQGLLERAASQEDGRRSIVRMTEAGKQVLEQIEEIKRELIIEATAGWPQDDIARFATLYDRFTVGLEAQLDQFEQGE